MKRLLISILVTFSLVFCIAGCGTTPGNTTPISETGKTNELSEEATVSTDSQTNGLAQIAEEIPGITFISGEETDDNVSDEREVDNDYCPVTSDHKHTFIEVVGAWDEYKTVEVEKLTPVIVGYTAYTENGTCINDIGSINEQMEWEKQHCPNACLYDGDVTKVPDPIPGSCIFQGVREEPMIEYQTETVQEQRFVQHHEEEKHHKCDSCGYEKY